VSGIKNVSVDEATALLREGYSYVDVRSEPEFELGHPDGAFNVPISLRTPSGPQPNTEFVPTMERAFSKDAPLVVGCQSGPRAVRAAQALEAAGFTQVVVMPGGFGGARDAFGRPVPGWQSQNLPVEKGQPEGRSHAALSQLKAK
jgi:rhodanese-related sulfurtransferase